MLVHVLAIFQCNFHDMECVEFESGEVLKKYFIAISIFILMVGLGAVVISQVGIKKSFIVAVLIAVMALTGCQNVKAEGSQGVSDHLVMERLTLPAQFKNPDGSSYMAELDALVVRPDDHQAHPLAVINYPHIENPKNVYADDWEKQTKEFARRGWVAVAFTARGYGLSEGQPVGQVKECSDSEFVRSAQVRADDVREVMRLMAEKTYVDHTKIISIALGISGYTMLSLVAEPSPGLVAVITFAGGWTARKTEMVACYNQSQINTAAGFGKSARIPMLWIVAENDNIVPLSLLKEMHAAFNKSGGKAELLVTPPFETDAHFIFSKRPSIWGPLIDNFLQKQNLQQRRDLIPLTYIRMEYENP